MISRLDIYSLGMIAFCCLTGTPMREGGDRISSLRPDLASEWDPIIGKATRIDPSRRFQSAEEMLSYISLIEVWIYSYLNWAVAVQALSARVRTQ